MTTHFINPANEALPKTFINKTEAAKEDWTLRHIGAGIGLLGGLMLLFSGVSMIIFQYFSGEKQTAVWLLAAVLPLWIIGAHCLDKLEDTDKARRIEYCKQHGMTEEITFPFRA